MISQKYKKTCQFSEEYFKYSKYLTSLDIKEETIDWRLKHIRGFILFLESKNIRIKDIDPIIVYNYMDSISKLSKRTRENRAICIRLFLNYLYDLKLISYNGKQIFPIIKNNKLSTITSYYSIDEINKIINSVDINVKNGKRDFAILLLFITYGLRLKDVQNLKIQNLYWNDNKIILIQNKDNELNEFPMTKDIKYALIDYWKNERSKSNSDFFFLNNNGLKISSYSIYSIVNKYFKKSNVNILNRHHGPHSLRSSLATSLLEDKNGIDVISGVLGHDEIDTTKIYARINFHELKKLSLEVPTWKN